MPKRTFAVSSSEGRSLVILPIFVILLLSACGKVEEKAPWPGHLKGYNGFSDSEKDKVGKAILMLNEKAGATLISEDGENTQFTIQINKVSANSWPESRAGFATVNPADCKVEISDVLFNESGKADYLYPVVWHELGHCAGLSHLGSDGEIMSPTTSVLSAYPSTIISRFIKSVRSSAGL